MRGAKAKAIRRLAKKSGLPERTYGVKEVTAKITHPVTREIVEYKENILVLGRSQRGMVQRIKHRLEGSAFPLVGMERAARVAQRQAEEGLKNMEIIPVEAPNAAV